MVPPSPAEASDLAMSGRRAATIAFFSHSSGVAGAERAMVHAVQEALARGHRPVVYLPGAGPLAEELAGLGVPTETFEYFRHFDAVPDWWTVNHWRNIWSGFGARVASVQAQLASRDVSLVVVNTIWPVEPAFAAARAGLPLVWHPHELYHPRFHDWLLGMPLFETLMGALSDVVVSVSTACHEALLPYVPADKLTLVHEPVDWSACQQPHPVPDDLRAEREGAAHVLACVGSIDKRKAQSDLLDALTRMPAGTAARIRTWIVGTPGNEDLGREFQAQLERLPAHVRVRWLGQRPDVTAILQAVDLLVHPSINDPFPLAVLEALACGKPVVAARGGGVVESVADGVTGRLVPCSDPDALAAALAEVLGDGERLRAMGAAARDSVRRFDVGVYRGKMAEVLERGLAAGPAADARRTLAETFQQRVDLLARSLIDTTQGNPSTPPPTLAHRVRKTLRAWMVGLRGS